MFYRRALLAFIFGVIVFVGVERNALAQRTGENANAGTAQGAELVSNGWNLGCTPLSSTKELRCEASQTIAVAKSRQTLLVVFVTPWQQAKAANHFVLRLQLPHGLDLPKGIKIQIDDKPVQSPVIRTSTQAGVYARIGLSAPLLASLKKGTTMKVSFTAMNGNKLTVPVSLDGFSTIFARLK